jgi:4'-phosphopantetheinyl transferase
MAASLPGLTLSDDDVHVWCVSLQQPIPVTEQLACLLSADEKARAARYQFEHLQKSFIVARGMLRIFLASYLDLQPEQLGFTYLPAGKPQLAENLKKRIYFNLAHSHEFVLYAFSPNRNVGIDIEHIRPIDDIEQIAQRTFSAIENYELKRLPPEQILEGFFNCWTRKEAYIKAIGDGLSFPLRRFDVSLTPGEPAKIRSIFGSKEEAARWFISELQRANGYAAALVVEGKACEVSYHEWKQLDFTCSFSESK